MVCGSTRSRSAFSLMLSISIAMTSLTSHVIRNAAQAGSGTQTGAGARTGVITSETDFAHDVVPVLKKHCVGCHGGREAKGSFSMNNRELVVSSGHIVPGKPDESHLLELVRSADLEQRMPPKDKPPLTDEEKSLLEKWILDGMPWDDGFSFAPPTYEPPLHPRRPDLPPVVNGRENPVDRLLDAWLLQHGRTIPPRVDDRTFLRRVTLDLTGLLPTPSEIESFLASRSETKRQEKVRELLNNRIAYADHWLTFFNDLLRNDYSGTGFITGGRQQVTTWLYESLLNNKPFDQMARELIAPPTGASQGYIDGIRWRGEVSAGQTVEIQFAQSVSQSFLGINMKCASCHDSFIDRWKLDEAYGLAAIYSSRPLDIHRCDKPIGRQAEAKWLFPELGQIDPAAPREERLRQLAALMTHPENGRFSRTIVNRLWYKLMGRGIVHPLDAMQSEPWNPDLLDVLATSLTDNHYDLKEVLYLIATSEAYQSPASASDSSEPRLDQEGRYLYAGPHPRRLTAEQFMDAVWQITGASPTSMDAAVFRAIVDETQKDSFNLSASWIWGDTAANGKTPAAGDRLLVMKTFTLNDEPERGGALVTCDNSYQLFLNGRQVSQSSDWQRPEGVALQGYLKKGENQLVAIVQNGGDQENLAGFFFEGRVMLKDGSMVPLQSDATWEFTPNVPEVSDWRLGPVAMERKPVTIVNAIPAWTSAIQSNSALLAQVVSGSVPPIRASLIKSDFLMRSLGRPMREQIVSMRPSEVTTLEAIDLANGPTLAAALTHGAQSLSAREWKSADELIRHVYLSTLTREPDPEELEIVRESLGDHPAPQQIEDFLWAILMTPEFLLVR
ncbi:MAG: DUF1549 domain-containing protein [Planctomyces sp.]|nr:DUF1549 domain-containing protein [Planctomyces sp.]